ncbi:MAG: helix-turn-helix domain-containing protein [Blautia sp.]|nr:helix-turn-helix domain-containing protein [Blautia sp.]
MIANLTGIYETVDYDTDVYFKLYDNTDLEAYPRHWHTCIEIIMPVHGDYRMEYDSHPVTLREGDILFLCPGTLHSFEACEGERFIFQAEMPSAKQLKSVQSFLTLYFPGILLTPETAGDTYASIRPLFEGIIKECQEEPTLHDAAIYSQLLEIMVRIRRHLPPATRNFDAPTNKQKEYLETFMEVCSYISDHCTEEITLDMAAGKAGFSKYHFSRLFKQFTGVSYYKYLNQKRIECAEQYLIHPEISVTEVSLSCGFQSLSAFIRMFKQVKGCTPTEYRAHYER